VVGGRLAVLRRGCHNPQLRPLLMLELRTWRTLAIVLTCVECRNNERVRFSTGEVRVTVFRSDFLFVLVFTFSKGEPECEPTSQVGHSRHHRIAALRNGDQLCDPNRTYCLADARASWTVVQHDRPPTQPTPLFSLLGAVDRRFLWKDGLRLEG